jgi:hypothetical protein
MKEQYIAEYQQENYEPGKWKNAVPVYFSNHFGKIVRECSTLEEAQAALREVKEYFNGKPRTTTQTCGCIGITSHTDSKTANVLMVTKTRIRVRLVSEWQTLEEQ